MTQSEPSNRLLQSQVELRELRPADWPEVAAIHQESIRSANATFETEVPTWLRWDATHFAALRLVAVENGRVIGWAALGPVSERACYAGVAENSVYVLRTAQRRGVGRALLERLIADSEQAGIWTIQTGIFPENEASIRLHERCGFRVVGVRKRLGKLNGEWRDVVLLERRSEEVT